MLERVMVHFAEFAPLIQGAFPVSNKNGAGLDVLKKAIISCAQQRLSKMQVPLVYSTLSQLLEQKALSGNKVLFWKDVQALSSLCELKDSDSIYNALEFLHQAGLVVFISNPEDNVSSQENQAVVISDPQVLFFQIKYITLLQWISDVVSSIVSFTHSFGKTNGILTFSDLAYVWKPLETQGNNQLSMDRLIDILVKLEFAFKLPTNQGILVPHLLPVSRPSLSSLWPITLPTGYLEWGRTLLFPFLPIGFFGKLATRLFHLSSLHKIDWWQNGLLFRIDSKRSTEELVLLEFVDTGDTKKSLVIRFRTNIKSPDSTQAFAKIVDTVDNLLEGFYPKLGSSVVRLVPCTHCLLQQNSVVDLFHFSQHKCVSLLVSGEQYAYCNDMTTRPVPLSELVPDLSLDSISSINLADITKLKELGEGGFGMVWKGLFRGITVAVKELKSEGKSLVEKFDEFYKETRIMSMLTHPNVVRLFGISLSPPALVMEYIPNGDLFHFLHRNKNSPAVLPQVLQLLFALDIANGLAYLHSLRPPIIHRDLR